MEHHQREGCISTEHLSAHYKGLRSGLTVLLEDDIFCDVTLVTKGQRFKCHKVILCAFSSFFKSMFTIEMKESSQNEVHLDVIEAATLQKVIAYMYKGGEDFELGDIYELLPTSVYLQIYSLQTTCEAILTDDVKLSTVLELWTLSTDDYPQLHVLREKCENFMLEKYGSYFHDKQFLQNLNASQMSFLAAHYDICVPGEHHLINMFIIKWFQYDFENRQQYLLQVFEKVCFLLLGKNYIFNEFPYRGHPSLKTLMQEADRFFSNPGQQIHFDSPRAQPRSYDAYKKSLIVMGKFDNFYPNPTDDIWSYDMPIAGEKHGEWTRLETVPINLGPGYQTCVYGVSSIVVTGGKITPVCMSYDGIENKWVVHNTLPTNQIRWNHCMAVVKKALHILGGKTFISNTQPQMDSDINTVAVIDYDSMHSSDAKWQTCGELLDPVFDAACLTSESQIFVFNSSDVMGNLQCFDTVTNTCSRININFRFSSQILADGNSCNAYLMSAEKLYHFNVEKGLNTTELVEHVYTLDDNKCKSVSGLVKNGDVLYIVGNFSDGNSKSATRGVMNFDLVNRCIVPGIEKFTKHPFLPSGLCRCHYLVVKKKFHTNREIDQFVRFSTNQLT